MLKLILNRVTLLVAIVAGLTLTAQRLYNEDKHHRQHYHHHQAEDTTKMKRSHYAVKRMKSLPSDFLELAADEGTREFLREAKVRRSAFKDSLATVLKGAGYSLTDANGMVDRGRMFLFSPSHLELLFGTQPKGKWLLDVGAGDGNITTNVAPGFEKVVATEFSVPMVRRLRERGYLATSRVDSLSDTKLMGQHCYDLVMMLNVLDRADKPLTLLQQLKKLVKPGTGHLILAVVLPWCPFVENGKQQLKPSESLPMRGGGLCVEGASFEQSVAMMAENVLIPAGFDIVKWTKLPYLCEGDGTKDYYVLDDAVFLLKVRDGEFEDPEEIEPGISNVGEDAGPSSSGVADWILQKLPI